MTSHPETRLPDEPRRDGLREAAKLARTFLGQASWEEPDDEAAAGIVLDHLDAALAARPEPELPIGVFADDPEPLDAAWKEAAEARPTGFLSVCRWEDGVYRAVWAAVGSSPRHSADGPTPAAALRALAATLRSTKPG
jgi:hypothetical protein